jgi:hypothetical protein
MKIHKHKCVFVGCLPGYQVFWLFFCHTTSYHLMGWTKKSDPWKPVEAADKPNLGQSEPQETVGRQWLTVELYKNMNQWPMYGLCKEISPQNIALYGTVPYSTSILGSWNSHWMKFQNMDWVLRCFNNLTMGSMI